jgi:hypothetical protein
LGKPLIILDLCAAQERYATGADLLRLPSIQRIAYGLLSGRPPMTDQGWRAVAEALHRNLSGQGMCRLDYG